MLAIALTALAIGAWLTVRRAQADGADAAQRASRDGARALLALVAIALLAPLALAASGIYDRFNGERGAAQAQQRGRGDRRRERPGERSSATTAFA